MVDAQAREYKDFSLLRKKGHFEAHESLSLSQTEYSASCVASTQLQETHIANVESESLSK